MSRTDRENDFDPLAPTRPCSSCGTPHMRRAASSSESVPETPPMTFVDGGMVPSDHGRDLDEFGPYYDGNGNLIDDADAPVADEISDEAKADIDAFLAAPIASTTPHFAHFVCGPTCGCGNLTPFVRVGAYWRSPDACAHCGKKFGQPTLFGTGEKDG